MSDSRVHRPPLQRTEPNRDFGTILGRAGSFAAGHEDGNGCGGDSRDSVVGEGVRMAYRVIDTYLKQGQQVAQQCGRFAYGPVRTSASTSDLQARSLQLMTDLVATYFDLLGVYTDALSPLADAFQPKERSERPSPRPPTFGGREPATQLLYEITSSRPALVDAEFFPGRETRDLASHGLRRLGSSDRSPINVNFEPEPDGQRVVVQIRVSDEQPVGLYTGSLLNARDGTTVGSLSLRVR